MLTFIFSSSKALRSCALLVLTGLGGTAVAASLDVPVTTAVSLKGKGFSFTFNSPSGVLGTPKLEGGRLRIELPSKLSAPGRTVAELLSLYGTCQGSLSPLPAGFQLVPTGLEAVVAAKSGGDQGEGPETDDDRETDDKGAPKPPVPTVPASGPVPVRFTLSVAGKTNTQVIPVFSAQKSSVSGALTCAGAGHTFKFTVQASFQPGWNLMTLEAVGTTLFEIKVGAALPGDVKLAGQLQ